MLVSVALAFLAAAVEPTAATPAQAPAPAAKPKKVCHVEEAVTGSLTPKRVCVTVPATAPVSKPAEEAAGNQPQPAPAGGK